jgi:hypothetical protein
MPLEEPSGSSVPSAPEEEEETMASKQTHILEQVKKRMGSPKGEPLLNIYLVFHLSAEFEGKNSCSCFPDNRQPCLV